MIKRILIPLDPSEYSDAAVDYGCMLASYLDAELTGMAVLDTPGIEKTVGTVPAGSSNYLMRLREAKKMKELIKREEREHITEILEKFTQRCESKGVKNRVSRDQGMPSDVILQKSLFFDFIIVGLVTRFQYRNSKAPSDSLDKILDSSVTPMLAVPNTFHPLEKCKVVIAFDGSEPSVRALHQFTKIIRNDIPGLKISILVGDDDKLRAGYLLDNAELYLKAHGFQEITKEWTTKNIINAFEEKYCNEFDLFVLGMHSKKIFADFFVGSLSKYLINKKDKTIFLGQ